MATEFKNGPSLGDYVETRLNIITEEMKKFALISTMDERDTLYTERANAAKTAVDTAVTAVKDQTKMSFDASEKAIERSDVNSDKWRANANEWRAAMVDREQRFSSRQETDNEFKSLRIEIEGLKRSRDMDAGKSSGYGVLGAAILAAIAAVTGIAAAVIALLR
jgi:hypothetical protein